MHMGISYEYTHMGCSIRAYGMLHTCIWDAPYAHTGQNTHSYQAEHIHQSSYADIKLPCSRALLRV